MECGGEAEHVAQLGTSSCRQVIMQTGDDDAIVGNVCDGGSTPSLVHRDDGLMMCGGQVQIDVQLYVVESTNVDC